MTRPALGRGRLTVILGSLVTLVGLIPTWWLIERTGLEPLSGNGLEGAGLVVFLAMLAMLAVVVLPFASRDGESVFDRAPVYALLLLVAGAAYAWRVYEIFEFGGIEPARTLGLWVTGAGLLIVAWGIGWIATDKPRDDGW